MSMRWKIILVGFLWGISNPLMKKGAAGDGSLRTFLQWKVAGAFAVNQLGSLCFYYTLGTESVSSTAISCNAVSLLFTALSSAALGESMQLSASSAIGAMLIVVGVFLCTG